jgi:hypothetical protein
VEGYQYEMHYDHHFPLTSYLYSFLFINQNRIKILAAARSSFFFDDPDRKVQAWSRSFSENRLDTQKKPGIRCGSRRQSQGFSSLSDIHLAKTLLKQRYSNLIAPNNIQNVKRKEKYCRY